MTKLRVLLFETPEDPYYNLAFEEAFLLARHLGYVEDDTLRIWRNSNAVVIGYFQFAEEEVRIDAVNRLNVKVVRRFTGGGAVYHDLGNINYAIVVRGMRKKGTIIDNLYKYLLGGAVKGIKELGVNARIENINDIVTADRKISGCAAKYLKDTLFLHGSLLVNTDLSKLASVLKISKKKLADKGISSVKYRVTTLNNLLGKNLKYGDIIEALVKGYSSLLNAKPYFDLPSKEEIELANRLYNKYISVEWNYKRAPSSRFTNLIKDFLK